MRVYVYTNSRELLCDVPTRVDARGFLAAEHPTFNFEVQVATYCYNEGEMQSGTIEDKNDITVATWEIK
jgi:hypothetical protein